jgi:cephalosporin hydroxylase
VSSDAEPAGMRDDFHRWWYDSAIWTRLRWFGVPVLKNPFDLFQYQEILFEQRPDYVVECGAAHGGSTLYFAHLLDLLGHGRVISVDLEGQWSDVARSHPRVTVLQGDSVAAATVAEVRRLVPPTANCFVILDSDHRLEHVLAELRAYRQFVQPGHYLVVEDGNINGHPVLPEWGPGPYEAVEVFLHEDRSFERDEARAEKLGFTFAPSGWLRRRSPSTTA